jgi:carbon dioxide concentrating mechanism protein CcmL
MKRKPPRRNEIFLLQTTIATLSGDLPGTNREPFEMKLGAVIGRITLSRTVPGLTGARWLIVSPFTREQYQRGAQEPPGAGKEPSLVVYDNLGGALGQTIGYIEGREAAQPFDEPTPVDAINAALIDEIFHSPPAQ